MRTAIKPKCFLGLFLGLSVAMGASAQANTRYLITQSTTSDCGPAALATLLNYYFDIPATELEMVRLTGSKPEIGTSMLGLEKAAVASGCAAGSFRMTLATLQNQIATYPAPIIVRTLNPEPHFSLVLAIDKDYVYLADPAIGNLVLRKDAFLQRWYIPSTGGTKTPHQGAPSEGYVFVAAAPGARVNLKRREQVVRGLSQQLRNLETMREPVRTFWR